MALTSNIKDGDWVSVRQANARLGSSKLGPTSSPTFGSVKVGSISISGLTADSLIYPNSSGLLTSLGVATNGQLPIGSTGSTPILATLTGTANRVTVTNGSGTITLSTPQDTHTGATNFTVAGLTISALVNETTDVDTFLVANTGLVKYRTGDEVLSDIGASSTAHRHDGHTLEHDAVNSDGGAFSFTTTGLVTFNQSIASANYTASNLLTACTSNAGTLDFSAASKTLTVEDNSVVSQDYSSDASPTFATVDLTSITDGNLPYIASAGAGFTDSPLSTDGTDVRCTGILQATDFAKTGWPLSPGVTLSFDDASKVFTVTDGGSAYYYINGVKYTLGGNKTVDLDDIGAAEGLWFIYFSGATLTASQTPWSITDDNKALVAYLYWDNTNNRAIGLGYELHSFLMDAATHKRLHEGGGAAWESGLLVSDAGSEDVNVSAGEIHDEDIDISITDGAGGSLWEQVLSPAEIPIYYRDGASAWRSYTTANKGTATDVAYIDGSNNLHYNKLNGTWASTATTVGKYVAYFVIASNEQTEPVGMIMGQRVDNTLAVAKANNVFSSLSLSGLPFQEMVLLARIIVKSTNSGVYYTIEDIQDLRATNAQGNVTSPLITDHGGLGGLADDDHPQYLLADGTRALAGAWDMGNYALTNVNIDTGDINVAVTNTEWDAAYTHVSSSGSDHTFLDQAVTIAASPTHADLTLSAPSNIYALSHDSFADFVAAEHENHTTWTGSTALTTLGTIATGTWEATDVGIAHGGTGASTAQAAIDALTAVSGATTGEVLTKDGSGNATFQPIEGTFVSRGGASVSDFDEGDTHVANGTWNDLDLGPSGLDIVPAGARAVALFLRLKHSVVGWSFSIRKNGETASLPGSVAGVATQVANVAVYTNGVIGCDSNGVIEYRLTGTTDEFDITVVGWWL